jgi:hypothetical protein
VQAVIIRCQPSALMKKFKERGVFAQVVLIDFLQKILNGIKAFHVTISLEKKGTVLFF